MDQTVGRPRQVGIHHLGLSVTDVERSTAFYCEVLGATVVRPPHRSETFSGKRSIVRVGPNGIDLNQFDDSSRDQFDPKRTGLDHVAFTVESLEDLEAWAQWVDGTGVARSIIRDGGGVGAVFDLVDPDGIQIEFYFLDREKLSRSALFSAQDEPVT